MKNLLLSEKLNYYTCDNPTNALNYNENKFPSNKHYKGYSYTGWLIILIHNEWISSVSIRVHYRKQACSRMGGLCVCFCVFRISPLGILLCKNTTIVEQRLEWWIMRRNRDLITFWLIIQCLVYARGCKVLETRIHKVQTPPATFLPGPNSAGTPLF